jgi:hypothetical protein
LTNGSSLVKIAHHLVNGQNWPLETVINPEPVVNRSLNGLAILEKDDFWGMAVGDAAWAIISSGSRFFRFNDQLGSSGFPGVFYEIFPFIVGSDAGSFKLFQR